MPYRSITLCAFALLAMFSVANSQADNAFARETFSAELANLTPLRVVTTFTILQDLVSELGGGHVDVMNLVGPNGDAHTYQPKPSDAIALKQAELVVFNGLGFEGWLPRLMDTVNYDNRRLAASEGVDAIFLDNEPDPHAWQSFRNIRIYVDNISQTLVDLLPKHSLSLKARRKQYISRIDMLEQEFLRRFGEIPPKDRVVVTSHDSFGYLARDFQITFLAPVGINVEIEATAADVAEVIEQIRERQVQALFVENITNPLLIQRIADETNKAVGGRLYSDALSEAAGPAGTYLKMMRHNMDSIVEALAGHTSDQESSLHEDLTRDNL